MPVATCGLNGGLLEYSNNFKMSSLYRNCKHHWSSKYSGVLTLANMYINAGYTTANIFGHKYQEILPLVQY